MIPSHRLRSLVLVGCAAGVLALGAAAQAARPQRLQTGVDLTKLHPTTPAVQAAAPGTAPSIAPAALPSQPAPLAVHSPDDGHGHDHGAPAQPGFGTVATPPPQNGPAPSVVWLDGEKDFGELIQGQTADHTFRLKNGGEGDLIISQIKPSCGCTHAATSVVDDGGNRTPYSLGAAIRPNQEFEVSIHFNTQGKRDQAHGQVSLYCNDPRTVINLLFKANVKTFLNVEPTYLNLESMATTDVREGHVTVKSTMVPKFKLAPAPDVAPELKIQCTPRGGDAVSGAPEWDVHVTLGPGVPEGTFNRNIRLLTDQPLPGAAPAADGKPTMHETQFMVMAQVKGMVTCEPMFVSYGMLRPGQASSRTLRISCNDPAFQLPAPKLSLTNLKGEPFEYDDYITRTVKPIAGMEGKAYDVELVCTGMPETLNGNFMGTLTIETGHPTKPKVEVRFTGVCRPGAAPIVTPPVAPAAGAQPPIK
ncbi:MAG: DUF1573 domain-containing protein [Planctomycetota bacterium]|nr:MAG: DUF1573 domain-containing protein [Planctomycetota bacterium]